MSIGRTELSAVVTTTCSLASKSAFFAQQWEAVDIGQFAGTIMAPNRQFCARARRALVRLSITIGQT